MEKYIYTPPKLECLNCSRKPRIPTNLELNPKLGLTKLRNANLLQKTCQPAPERGEVFGLDLASKNIRGNSDSSGLWVVEQMSGVV